MTFSLDAFYAHKNAAFLFLFGLYALCVFVLFVLVKFSCKKKSRSLKLPLITSFTILLRFTLFRACKKLFVRTYFYLWSSVKIFLFYKNFFKSFLIDDHPWECFSFMKIFKNLFLFMIICLNLFLFMIIFFNLFFFITIFFNDHNTLQSSQFFSIITILFNHHNIFPLSQSFSIITIFFNDHYLYENKLKYEFHHLTQIFYHQNMIMIFCQFHRFLFYVF